MIFGKTIKLFLIDGETNERLSCELSNCTGKAYKLPRNTLKKCTDRPELQTTGIYLLIGKNDNSSEKPQIYIGEAEDIYKRLLQHLKEKDFYIDLVFYKYLLKCFEVIDLKTDELTHQDVGQLDMYVRMYDDLKRTKTDNPTIGILLCTDKDETVVKYSMLSKKKQLFASKYMLYLPIENELKA